MANRRVTITGKPNAEIRIVYRDHGDEPPDDVFRGHLDDLGKLEVELPEAYLVVLSKDAETAILALHSDPELTEVALEY